MNESVFTVRRRRKMGQAVAIETRFFVEGAVNALALGLLFWAAFGVAACRFFG